MDSFDALAAGQVPPPPSSPPPGVPARVEAGLKAALQGRET